MVGLDARATMDLDATIKGTNVSVEDVEMIISKIISIPLNDGVLFRIKRISEICASADFFFDRLRTKSFNCLAFEIHHNSKKWI